MTTNFLFRSVFEVEAIPQSANVNKNWSGSWLQLRIVALFESISWLKLTHHHAVMEEVRSSPVAMSRVENSVSGDASPNKYVLCSLI